jgi:hypothetical protein
LHNYVTKDPDGVLRYTSRLMQNENIKPQELIRAVENSKLTIKT